MTAQKMPVGLKCSYMVDAKPPTDKQVPCGDDPITWFDWPLRGVMSACPAHDWYYKQQATALGLSQMEFHSVIPADDIIECPGREKPCGIGSMKAFFKKGEPDSVKKTSGYEARWTCSAHGLFYFTGDDKSVVAWDDGVESETPNAGGAVLADGSIATREEISSGAGWVDPTGYVKPAAAYAKPAAKPWYEILAEHLKELSATDQKMTLDGLLKIGLPKELAERVLKTHAKMQGSVEEEEKV